MGQETALVSALQGAMETQLSELNTAMPGVVVSYEPSRNRAVVRPSLPKALADGRVLDAPNVVEVPIAWTAAGGAVITMPVRPGDGVLLLFAQRSLEGWLSGSDAAPDDPRRFDLSDAVALPGLRATGVSADPDAVEVRFDGSVFRQEPGGITRLRGTRMFIEMPIETTSTLETGGNILSHGRVDAAGDVTASNVVSLLTHRHLASGGTGTGGPPVT